MSSKAYSTRLNTEEPNQYEIAVILDCLDSDSSGLLNSSEWLLQAALMRQEQDRNAELSDYVPAKEYIPLIEHQIQFKEESTDIVEVAAAEQVTTPEEYIIFSEEQPIEAALQNLLATMSAEEKGSWLKQAALMRFAIEQDVPGYFINRWNQKEVPDPEVSAVQYEWEESLKIDHNEPPSKAVEIVSSEAESIEEQVIEPPAETAIEPQDDGFNVYRSALPQLLRLEVFQNV